MTSNRPRNATSATRSARNTLTRLPTPRSPYSAHKGREGGYLTLSGLVVMIALAFISVAFIKTQVVDPLRAQAEQTVTTLDRGLDCLADPDTRTC
jgi:hypothetical protein